MIEAYKKDIDRTLLRENLKLSVEQRFEKHMQFQRFAEELREAGEVARGQAVHGTGLSGGAGDPGTSASPYTCVGDAMKTKTEGVCELCGHCVHWRQKAHVVAEGRKTGNNRLMLCPSCHVMFDTHVKPTIHRALIEAGVENLPVSWEKSIYEQAAEASAEARRQAKTREVD